MAAWRKVGYCYPSELEKTLCKWDIHFPLVTKGLSFNSVWRDWRSFATKAVGRAEFHCVEKGERSDRSETKGRWPESGSEH